MGGITILRAQRGRSRHDWVAPRKSAGSGSRRTPESWQSRERPVADMALIRVQCMNGTDARQEPCDDAQILFLLGDGLPRLPARSARAIRLFGALIPQQHLRRGDGTRPLADVPPRARIRFRDGL